MDLTDFYFNMMAQMGLNVVTTNGQAWRIINKIDQYSDGENTIMTLRLEKM